MQIIVRKIVDSGDMTSAHHIRNIVFVEEQHCPAALEWEHDDVSTHFLALADGQPCGAARWRKTAGGYKLERFAVLSNFRRSGVGAALLRVVLADLPDDGLRRYLNAQLGAVPFYLRFGFQPVGDLFTEAGIVHQQMTCLPAGHP